MLRLIIGLVLVVASGIRAEPTLNATEIKCRVCAASISHVWQTGEALRRHCEAHADEVAGRLCDGKRVQPDAIIHLVETTCDYLPATHAGITKSMKAGDAPSFDLVRRRHHPKWRGLLDNDEQIEVAGHPSNPTKSHPGHELFHGDEDAAVLREVCVKWLHERHTIDKMAAIVFSNLQGGRTEKDIMRYLRRRFCFPACGNGSRRLLKKPRWDDEL